MNYEIMGACGPFGCAPPGAVPYNPNPYYPGLVAAQPLGAGYGGYGYGGYAEPEMQIMGGAPYGGYYPNVSGYDANLMTVGQGLGMQTVTTPAAGTTTTTTTTGTDTRTFGEKTSDWLNQESLFGARNKTLLGIAIAGGLGYYAYSEGWFGRRRGGRAESDVGGRGRDRSRRFGRSGSRRDQGGVRDFFW